MRTEIWAHRGASAYAPENTMEAFKLAYEMGAEGIELDVHLSKEGEIIVAHDETIDRCSNGKGLIADKTLSELLEYDFSNHKPGFQHIRIPTLKQVLEFISQTNLMLNVEIKSGAVIYEGIEDKLVKLVSEFGLTDRVIYSSFNHYSLMLVRRADPQAQIGILYTEAMVDPHIYAKYLRANAVHPYYQTLLVPGTLEGCKNHDIRINAWTVDKPEHLAWMFSQKVDAVITNCPDTALKVRNTLMDTKQEEK